MSEKSKLYSELHKLNRYVCCLLKGNQDWSLLPEYENNTAAINAGLKHGDRYRLPMENDRVLIAVVIIP